MVNFYKEILELRNYKKSTIKRIIQHTNHFLNWNKQSVEKTNYSIIEQYLVELKNLGLSEKTLSNRLSSIRGYYEFLALHGHIESNPVHIVKRLQMPETIPIYLPDNEINLLLDLSEKEKILNEVTTALNTGLRMNELRNLKWADINFFNRQLIVRGDIAKNKKTRTVPLNRKALEVLKEQYNFFSCFNWVFPGGQGGKGNKNKWDKNKMRSYNWWLRYSLDPIREQIPTIANLPKGNTCRGWHIMRHTFATKLARAGVDLIKIKEWMGHKSINTTLRYIHLQNQYDEAIELI